MLLTIKQANIKKNQYEVIRKKQNHLKNSSYISPERIVLKLMVRTKRIKREFKSKQVRRISLDT